MENQGGRRRESAIEELLIRGQDFTSQLKQLLLTTDSKQPFLAPDAQDLVAEILSTFTHTISLLNAASTTVHSSPSSDEASRLSSDGPRKSSESSSGDSTSNDPPGCNKRGKTAAGQSWVKESPTLVDDGHAWRKYGQKTILKSDFPRHYYRCTHKFDQKCPATKQVQMVRDRPSPLYRTTYSSHHTCSRTTLHGSSSHQHLLVDPIDDDDSGSCHLISFSNSSTTTTTPFLASLSGSTSTPVKKQQESSSDVASYGTGRTVEQATVSSRGGGDRYNVLSSYVERSYDHGEFSGKPAASAAADDDDVCDKSFIQMMIMDSVDDFGGLMGLNP